MPKDMKFATYTVPAPGHTDKAPMPELPDGATPDPFALNEYNRHWRNALRYSRDLVDMVSAIATRVETGRIGDALTAGNIAHVVGKVEAAIAAAGVAQDMVVVAAHAQVDAVKATEKEGGES